MRRTLIRLLCVLLAMIGMQNSALAEFTERWSQEQALSNLDNPEVLILDVRSPAEYQDGRVPGAVNLPFDQIKDRQGELAGWQDKTLLIYCRSGRRASFAEQTLKELGFNKRVHLLGDMNGWQASALEVEK